MLEYIIILMILALIPAIVLWFIFFDLKKKGYSIPKRHQLAISMTLIGIFIIFILPYDTIIGAINNRYIPMDEKCGFFILVTVPFLLIVLGISTLIKTAKKIKKTPSDIRQKALNMVSKYLKFNGDIWSNLEIKNQHCSVELLQDGATIIVKELENNFRNFKILAFDDKDVMNHICYNFKENTTYDELLNLGYKLEVKIKELSELKKEIPESSKEFEVEEFKSKSNDDRNLDL